MKEITLRKYHRIIGVTAALFIVLQVFSGFLISLQMLAGAEWFGRVVQIIHYGDGIAGNTYRVVLALALLFQVGVGFWIYMKMVGRSGAARRQTAPSDRQTTEPREPVGPAR